MNQTDFIKHACEQVLRFTQVNNWDDLPEKIKVQLAFNMGVVALGLKLSKEDGYISFANIQQEGSTVSAFRNHFLKIVADNSISVDSTQITRPF